MLTSLAYLVLSSVAGIIVVDGPACAARGATAVVVDVPNRSRPVEFAALVFSGAIDPSGYVILGDVSIVAVNGKGRGRLELPALAESEKTLRSGGWVIFRSIQIEVDGRLVSSIGVEAERSGGQCIIVRL